MKLKSPVSRPYEGYMKKKVWLPIIIVIILLALSGGGVYALLYRPVEDAFAAAMAVSETAPYAEAKEAVTAAVQKLEGKPFAEERVATLNERLDQLLLAEADRAEAADELAYAAELIEDRDPARAQALRQTLAEREHAQALRDAYSTADALEKEGQDGEALAVFLALKDYEDAAQRAEAIQTRMQAQADFEAAKTVFTGENFDEAIAALTALGTAEAQAIAEDLQQQKAAWIEARRQQYQAAAAGRLSAGAWHTAAIGAAPWIAGDGRYAEPPAQADKVCSGLASVFYLSEGKVYTAGETFGAEETIAALTNVKKVAPGLVHALFLQADGHVTAVGSLALDRLPKEPWDGMIDVAAGAWHSVGLKADGTVTACGTNDHGQCDVGDWTNVTAVCAGLWHTAGLRADGTVAACGDNTYGQCDVEEWTDIVAISCGACTTVGLKRDGTVVACGDDRAGQCAVAGWTDVAVIAAGAYHTVALRLDGTIVAVGLLPADLPEGPLFDSDWTSPETVAQEVEAPAATIYIQGEDSTLGPWLYMDTNGIALICLDYSGDRELFRADMLATKNALPSGRVTRPGASGNYIQMPAVMADEQARNAHAVLAFTGDYLGWTSNRKGVMIRNGVLYYDRQETTTLAILPDGTLTIFQPYETSASKLMEQGVRDSFSFGPTLVEDGKKTDELIRFVAGGYDLFTTRVGFGYSDPYHYLAIVTPRERYTSLSWERLAEYFISYGARVAYNLDGGHSSSLVFMGRELSLVSTRSNWKYNNIRGLSDVVMFLEIDQSILDAREKARLESLAQENAETIEGEAPGDGEPATPEGDAPAGDNG